MQSTHSETIWFRLYINVTESKIASSMNWIGSKKKHVDLIRERLPTLWDSKHDIYIDLFLGGGALFFALNPAKAILSDTQEHLIDVYRALQSDVCNVLVLLGKLFQNNSKAQFDAAKPTFSKKQMEPGGHLHLHT